MPFLIRYSISCLNFKTSESAVSEFIASELGTIPQDKIPPFCRNIFNFSGYSAIPSKKLYASKEIISTPLSIRIDQSVFPQQ